MYVFLNKIYVTEECMYRLDRSSDMMLKLVTDSQHPIWQMRGNLRGKLFILSNCFDAVSTQLPVFGPLIDLKTF